MSLSRILTSSESHDINQALYALLDKTTEADVLKCVEAFNQIQNENERFAFFAQFKTSNHEKPLTHPSLLERMTHYLWIQSELMYLGNQKAALNKIIEQKNEIDQIQITARDFPSLMGTVARAIQEDAERGWSITRSIGLLKRIKLEVVGTEHPTDPLSEEARSTLTELANLLDHAKPNEEKLLQLMRNLQTMDAIPPARRSVDVEVSRNIEITTEKLYNNVPHLIDEILRAYKTFYGDEAFKEHENAIWEAMEASLVSVASWPGFDADGNDNVKAKEMREAIRLHRIRIAEKHHSTIKATVCKTAKRIEHDIRETIIELNYEIDDALRKVLSEEEFKKQRKQKGVLLDQRRFSALAEHYRSLEVDKESELRNLIRQQQRNVENIIQLTAFSGACRLDDANDEKLYEGDIQTFLLIFKNYRNQIRVNPDNIWLKDEQGHSHLATDWIITQYNQLMHKHHALLDLYPDLKRQMRHVGVQLNCFGMTYGRGHIRQDSDVFINVWEMIIADLKADEQFSNGSLFQYFDGKPYNSKQKDKSEQDCLEEEARRSAFHMKLQDKSPESIAMLHEIRRRYNDKYKNDKQFELLKTEMDRLELATLHPDLIDNIIISNCKSRYAADILGVESLLSIFSERNGQERLQVVPLLETRRDLENYESILAEYIQKRIAQFRALKGSHANLNELVIEVMIGFSDTERVSGLPALLDIQFTKENIMKLEKKYGVKLKLYHGPGGDPTRGGLKRRDAEGTLQGNARSNMLNTVTSTDWFVENVFYYTHRLLAEPALQLEFSNLPAHMQEWLKVCMKEGMGFYERLHNDKNGLGQLIGYWLGQGAHWLVSMLNSSSRAAQRGIADREGDRTASVQTNGKRPEPYIDPDKPRAITAVQMKEMLRDNLNFIGTYAGLKAIGLEASRQLFHVSPTFRDMVEKSMLGVAMRDLTYMAHALFAGHPELIPANKNERKEWAQELKYAYPQLLHNMDIKLSSKDPSKHLALLKSLSRLFAYIEEECEATQAFLFELNQSIYQKQHQPLNHPTDVLFAYPEWQAQAKETTEKLAPVSTLLAIHVNEVNNGANLNEVHAGLNDQVMPDSHLSGVGRVLGNEGAAITACRITPASYNYSLDNATLSPGVARAIQEEAKLDRPRDLPYNSRSVWRFFGSEVKEKLETVIRERPKRMEV